MNLNFEELTIAVLRDHRSDLVTEIENAVLGPAKKERDEAVSKVRIDASAEKAAAVAKVRREVETEQAAPVAPGGADQPKANDWDGWIAEHAGDPKLQAEFSEAKDYAAFRKADAAGHVKIVGRSQAA